MPDRRELPDQAAGLRRLHSPQPVKVIAFTGGKGGVGKTNLCVNLGVALALRNRRVILLDADLGLANADVLLGLKPAASLAELMRGERSLRDIVVQGPAGLRVVPGASGLSELANLDVAGQAAIIHAFSELTGHLDYLLVDTAAGIAGNVVRFCAAASEVVVVLCDEPTSLTDAYALVKVLSTEHGVTRFRVVTNMTHDAGEGAALFRKLLRVTERFLDVTLDHAGSVPFDDRVWRAVRLQTPFVTAFPSSLATVALKKLAARADTWERPQAARGNIEFFVERLIRPAGRPRLAVA